MNTTKERFLTKTPVICLLALLCCVLWGSAFPGIKTGYKLFEIASTDTGTQILFAGIRFFLAGCLTVLFESCMKHQFLVPKATSLRYIIPLSFFQTIIQYIFFYVGLSHTTGVKASIIGGCNVFVAIFIACIIFHQETMTVRKIIACIFGFIGVVLINLDQSASFSFSFTFAGEGFILFSTISSSISSVLMKRYSKYENSVLLSGYQFILGGAVMILSGLFMGGRLVVWSVTGCLLLLYLAFLSAAAYTIWSLLLSYNTVSKVSVYGFMTPVSGVVLSSLILQESSKTGGWTAALALCFVCVGIYLVNVQNDKSH